VGFNRADDSRFCRFLALFHQVRFLIDPEDAVLSLVDRIEAQELALTP
jgi:hypothetical protein